MPAQRSSDDIEMMERLLHPSLTSSLAVSRVTTRSTAPSIHRSETPGKVAPSQESSKLPLTLQKLYDKLPVVQDLDPTTGKKTTQKIRVLTVTSIPVGSSNANPIIEGMLEVVDISKTQRRHFNALSYCWGDQESNKSKPKFLLGYCTCRTSSEVEAHNSECNKDKVLVDLQENAHSAIYHLCTTKQEQKEKIKRNKALKFPIWIDNICINQEDKHEKPEQMKFMAQIYSSAKEAYFWLGEGDENTDSAMNYLEKACLPLKNPRIGSLACAFALIYRLGMRRWMRVNADLANIASRAWISRVWTLQECLLSQNGVVVCGFARVPWMAIVKSVSFYKMVQKRRLAPFPPEAWHPWMDLVDFWLQARTSGPGGKTTKAGDEIADFQKYASRSWRLYQTLAAAIAFLGLASITAVLTVFCVIGDRISNTKIGAGPTAAIGVLAVLALISTLPSYIRRGYKPEKNIAWIKVPKQEAMIHEILRRDCGELEDKYFGAQQLIDNSEEENENLKIYRNKPLESVYQHLTAMVLTKTQCLDLLLVGLYLKPTQKTASWVIDWSLALSYIQDVERGMHDKTFVKNVKEAEGRRVQMALQYANPLGAGGLWLGFRFYSEPPQWGLGGPKFRQFKRFVGPTPGSVSPDYMRVDEERGQIAVNGCIIAAITQLDTSMPPLELKAEDSWGHRYYTKSDDELQQGVYAFRIMMQGLEPSELDACTKYLLLISGYKAKSEHLSGFSGQVRWREIVAGNGDGNDGEAASKTVGLLKRAGHSKPFLRTRPLRIQEQLQGFVAATKTALARCEGDLYSGFGIACRAARQGDCVALIAGVSLPVVLRPSLEGDGYAVIGPAFLGGLMNGQVWEEVSRNSLKEINLR